MRLLLPPLLLACVAGPLHGQQDSARTADQREAYKWFRGLGYPDLARVPFVRFYNRAWERRGGRDPQAIPYYGFLLDDDGDNFTVFTVGLQKLQLTKVRSHQLHQRVDFERQSLAGYVRAGLHLMRPSAHCDRIGAPQ